MAEERTYTSLPVWPDTRDRLRVLKAQAGASYDELLNEMADQYDPPETPVSEGN